MAKHPEIVVPLEYGGTATVSLNYEGTQRTVKVAANGTMTEKQWRTAVRSVAAALKVIDSI